MKMAKLPELQVTLSRAVQRVWVRDVDGLLPAIEAALQAAGGPVDVDINRSDDGERSSRRELPKSCAVWLKKAGPNHPATRYLQTILSFIGNGS